MLLVGPRGRGGVARALELVAPHLPEARRVAGEGARALAAALSVGSDVVVHLHGSLRHRALVRDLAAARLARGPVVLQLHGTSARLRDALPAALARGLLRGLVVATVDPTVAERGAAWGVPILLVPNPVDVAATPARRDPEPGLVVFLGRRVREKGLPELLESVPRWPPGARLAVAGEGPIDPSGPRVTSLGWLGGEARRALLARASLVVLPSRSEGAPLAVLEALAAGVPVVATRVGAVPRLVGEAGVLVDAPTPEALARAVAVALAEPPPTQAARERVLRDHAPERVAGAWRALHALARRGPAR